jgi:hypothetical protein
MVVVAMTVVVVMVVAAAARIVGVIVAMTLRDALGRRLRFESIHIKFSRYV